MVDDEIIYDSETIETQYKIDITTRTNYEGGYLKNQGKIILLIYVIATIHFFCLY